MHIFNRKNLLGTIVLVLLLGAGAVGLAQQTAGSQEVRAQDLGVSEPRILPDNPVYFFKNWARGIQSFFTPNPVENAQLHERFLNEKLVELQKLSERNKNQQTIQNATTAIQREMERVKTQTGKIKENAQTSPEVNKFLDKFTQQNLLQQRVLEQIQGQVPPEVFKKIEAARQEHLQKFSEVMQKLENKDKIADRIKNVLNQEPDHQLKPIEDFQILEGIKSRLPAELKDKIKTIEEEKLQKMMERIEKMSDKQRIKFEEYFRGKGIDKEKQLEIIENLKSEILKKSPESPALKNMLEKIRENVVLEIQKIPETRGCPLWVPPLPEFCKEGRLVMPLDPQTGCKLPAKCVIPQDTSNAKSTACITLWDPVCGSDNKTYSNECFAKAAGVSMVYKGECQAAGVKPPIPAAPPTK